MAYRRVWIGNFGPSGREDRIGGADAYVLEINVTFSQVAVIAA